MSREYRDVYSVPTETYEDYVPRVRHDRLVVCPDCGAVVTADSRDVHDDWHARQPVITVHNHYRDGVA